MNITPTMNDKGDDTAFQPTTSIVDTVFDTVLGWIDVGLGRAKTTLSNGGRSLIRAAHAVEVVRERLRA